ncbi:8121_t:CDS:2, partial [Ambispora leptoticha]
MPVRLALRTAYPRAHSISLKKKFLAQTSTPRRLQSWGPQNAIGSQQQ